MGRSSSRVSLAPCRLRRTVGPWSTSRAWLCFSGSSPLTCSTWPLEPRLPPLLLEVCVAAARVECRGGFRHLDMRSGGELCRHFVSLCVMLRSLHLPCPFSTALG